MAKNDGAPATRPAEEAQAEHVFEDAARERPLLKVPEISNGIIQLPERRRCWAHGSWKCPISPAPKERQA